MKSERRIEKFLRRIDVIPDAERKRLRLEELLDVGDKNKKPTSADVQPTIRRFIMNRQILKVAASLVVIATVIGVIGIVQNGNQAAYAFEQTVSAMQGGHSYHIQTYYRSPTQRHDEFWAEFNEHGKLIRVRQIDQWKKEDWPVEFLWENQVEHKYKPGYWGGLHVIRKTEHHVDEDRLEQFNPETMIEEIIREVENGESTVAYGDSEPQDGYTVFEVTGNHPYRYVIFVDPETKLVRRMDQYNRNDDGDDEYGRGIEVLEYNQPFDPQLFQPDFPADTIIIDQLSRKVGMAQGGLSDEEVACEVARQALEALAADDYGTAGLLFGGAPPEYFEQRRPAFLKPVADIAVGEPRPYEWYGSTFMVPCSYVANQGGELTTINWTFWVITGEGQPGRWFVNPTYLEFSVEE